MSKQDNLIDDAISQLEGALCIWSRAKGETPAKQYFQKVTPNVRRLTLDGHVFQIVITTPEEDEESDK